MATKTSSQDLANLVINRVESQTAFQQMVAAGQVNANELYLVEGDETVTYSISKSGGTITLTGSDGSTSTVTVPTATSDLTNDSGFITSSSVPSASTSTPAMDGTGATGSSSAYARGDHVHPTDTSRAPTSHASTATTYGAGTSSNYGHLKLSASTTSTLGTSGGTAATPSAVKAVKDAIPTATSELTNDSGFITDAGVTSFNGSTGAITYTAPVTSVNGDTGDVTVTVPTATSDLTNDSGFVTSSSVPSATTTTPKMNGTAAVGSETKWAKGDHVHPTDTSRAPTSHASTATTYGAGTGSNYGHLKLSDSTTSTSGTSGGIAATPSAVKAVKDAIPTTTSDLTNDSGFITSADVPTATSELENDSGFITSAGAPVQSVNSKTGAVSLTYSDVSAAPTSHASTTTTYGAATSSNYGHVRLSDSTSSTSSTSGGYAATPAAVKAAYDLANSKTDNTGTITGVSANGTSVATSGVANIPSATTSRYGVTQLSSSTSSTSTTLAATASAVKAAYDLANGKQDALTFDSTPTSGSTNPVTSGGVYTALQSVAKRYSMVFTTSTWSNLAITVPASTHGCGTEPMVQVQRLNGTNYESYYGYPSDGWTVSTDTSGNITISVSSSGMEFSGRLLVR